MTLTLTVPGRLTEDVNDMPSASAAYCKARDLSGEGASTFPFGRIERGGVTIATVSYNGRVWSNGQGRGRGEDQLLYDPGSGLVTLRHGLKPLTFEGRFESNLDAIIAGKIWAFVAVTGENYGARLGVAIANEAGYNPIPEFWAHADRLDVMQEHADELNAAMGLTPRESASIICSTMAGSPRRFG